MSSICTSNDHEIHPLAWNGVLSVSTWIMASKVSLANIFINESYLWRHLRSTQKWVVRNTFEHHTTTHRKFFLFFSFEGLGLICEFPMFYRACFTEDDVKVWKLTKPSIPFSRNYMVDFHTHYIPFDAVFDFDSAYAFRENYTLKYLRGRIWKIFLAMTGKLNLQSNYVYHVCLTHIIWVRAIYGG